MPAPLKVMHLVRSLDVGGLENVVVDLINGMARQGVECHVGCLNHAGVWIQRISPAGLWEGHLGRQGRCAVIRSLRAYLRRHRIEILNSHNIQPHFYGAGATLGISAFMAPRGMVVAKPAAFPGHGRHHRRLARCRGGRGAE